jgi:hypothetical protein
MRPRGRFWVGSWLLFVLLILTWVVARQTSAVVTADELRTVRENRAAKEARAAELVARIRAAMSRQVLVPRAEALGLRLPSDSEIVILQTPAPPLSR